MRSTGPWIIIFTNSGDSSHVGTDPLVYFRLPLPPRSISGITIFCACSVFLPFPSEVLVDGDDSVQGFHCCPPTYVMSPSSGV